MRTYPKLMCSKTDPDSLVVYFATPNSGMIVHSTLEEKPLGTIYRDWEPADFDEVADDVIIWLTEGPKEAVEEAIAMVEKVKSLHQADKEYDGTYAYPDENLEVRMKWCTDCKFSISQDYGYSNYTVEGTSFYCAKRLHPEGTFDEFYGEDKRLLFAEQCPSFTIGVGVDMDVDQENLYDLTEEQKEVWQMHCDADT